jgi:hypothetical protein
MARLYRLPRRQAVTTSMRRVPDPNMAEPLMLELLHREGASRQAAMTMVV